MKRPHILLSSLLGCALAYGCAGDGAGDATQTVTGSASKGDSSGAVTGGSGGMGVTGGTTDDSAPTTGSASSDGEGCGFLFCRDTPNPDECDKFAQDCPEGQKCTAYVMNSGSGFDAVKCVEVTGTDRPGEACTSEGAASGVDSCIKGAMCWYVSDGVGTCVALCTAALVCEPPATCKFGSNDVLYLCIPDCDPLLQDCPNQAEACYPVVDRFSCAPDASGDAGAFGDACEFINTCDKGLACLSRSSSGPAARRAPRAAAARSVHFQGATARARIRRACSGMIRCSSRKTTRSSASASAGCRTEQVTAGGVWVLGPRAAGSRPRAALMLWICAMPRPTNQTLASALDPSDPLAQLNDGFRAAYAARREAVLAALGPAVAQVEDSLFLRLEGRRLVGPARTRGYHQLKAIAHLPLAIQVIVDDAGGSLAAAQRAQLVELRRRAAVVAGSLTDRGFDAQQLERQRRIVAASLAFIAAALDADHAGRPALEAFLGACMPDIRANIDDATRDQLQTMHATFGAWVQEMSAGQWSRLLVVVGASHMARTGNVAAQYFSLALGERWEGRFEQEDPHAGRRVLVSEAATDEHAAFSLLAMHVFDRRAANVFFGEEGRLGRDVLADAAERQLGVMFGARPGAASQSGSV